MDKTKFFQKYGELLVAVSKDDPEYGDFLILDSEPDIAQMYEKDGCRIVALMEDEDGEYVDWTMPVDYGYQPYKIGYFALKLEI